MQITTSCVCFFGHFLHGNLSMIISMSTVTAFSKVCIILFDLWHSDRKLTRTYPPPPTSPTGYEYTELLIDVEVARAVRMSCQYLCQHLTVSSGEMKF